MKLKSGDAEIAISASKNPCDRRGPLSTAVSAEAGVPSLARLMALAIHFDASLANGTIDTLAGLARIAHVSTSRISQLMKLLDLAPSIQEQLLFAPPDTLHVSEATLRRIANEIDWRKQEQLFHAEHAGRSAIS
jgi:hypothetical protein